jgi:hypothetical protein
VNLVGTTEIACGMAVQVAFEQHDDVFVPVFAPC